MRPQFDVTTGGGRYTPHLPHEVRSMGVALRATYAAPGDASFAPDLLARLSELSYSSPVSGRA